MTEAKRLSRMFTSRKGEAKPPPEPKIRLRSTRDGRRVGATLPTDVYVRFKGHVARLGITGEQAIVQAIELLLEEA